jgi:hypothetical protein
MFDTHLWGQLENHDNEPQAVDMDMIIRGRGECDAVSHTASTSGVEPPPTRPLTSPTDVKVGSRLSVKPSGATGPVARQGRYAGYYKRRTYGSCGTTRRHNLGFVSRNKRVQSVQ